MDSQPGVMAMANKEGVDLLKPGFFHLLPDLTEGKYPRAKVVEWYNKHSQDPDYLLDNCPERAAIDNTVGVLKYVLEGREKAIEYFKELTERAPKSINALANLQWLYGNTTGSLLAEFEDQDIIQGTLERGYFLAFYAVEQPHNPEVAEVALKFFDEGLQQASTGEIMLSRDISIWKYYRFRATKYCFQEYLITKKSEHSFSTLMSRFLDFYKGASNELAYYKASCLVEMALTFSFDSEQVTKQEGFAQQLREDLLKKIWEDPVSYCEKACSMYDCNYSLPLKSCRVCTKLELFEKAHKFLDRAEKLCPDREVILHERMRIYVQQATFHRNREEYDHSFEFLNKAYQCGKDIEQMQLDLKTQTNADMCHICLYQAYQIRRRHSLASTFDGKLQEAISYGERALSTADSDRFQSRLFYNLARCHQLRRDDTKAIEMYKEGTKYEKPGMTKNIFCYLKEISKAYQKETDDEWVNRSSTTLLEAYKKHPIDSVKEVFDKYVKSQINMFGGDFLHHAMQDLAARQDDSNSTHVVRILSGLVVKSPEAPGHLKAFCKRYV